MKRNRLLRMTALALAILMFATLPASCKPKVTPADSGESGESGYSEDGGKSSVSSSENTSTGGSSEELSSDDVTSVVDSGWGVSEEPAGEDSDYVYSRVSIPGNLISNASSSSNTVIEGLLNPSIVGIDKDQFLNEIRYPAPTTADFIIKATDYGVVVNDKKDDSVAMQAAIAACASKPADKTKLLVLPQGDLDFVEGFNPVEALYGIVIRNIDNLFVSGKDTNIYFTGELGFRGFLVSECENFQMNGISVDWGNLPFSMGTVEAMDVVAKTAIIRVNPGYPVDSSTKVIEYLEYDKKTNLPRGNGNFLYNHNEVKHIRKVEYLGDRKLRITFGVNLNAAPVGTKVALAHAMHFSESFIFERCKNVKLESINLYSSPGMGLRAYTCTNLYFNRFNCVNKPGTDRLLTVTADILHLKNTAGEIVITNSTLENSHDDAVNVGGHYLRIVEKNGTNKLRVISPLGMWGTFQPAVGDVYEASDINTLKVIKTVKVTAVENSYDGYWITVEGTTEGLSLNNALANLTRTPKFVFRNNLVRNKRNRGILVQTRDVLIENNGFSNIRHGAVLLLSEVNIFNESTAPKHVIIRNNKFVNNNQQAEADISVAAFGPGFSIGSPEAISDILIENNLLAFSSNSAFSFRGASDIIIRKNLVYNPALKPTEGKNNSAIMLENVRNLTLDGNKVYGGTLFGYKSVFIYGGVDVDTITLSGNNGIDRKDIYGDETVYAIKKNTGTIQLNDNSLADWSGKGTVIDMKAATDINVSEVNLNHVVSSDFSAVTKMLWNDNGIYYSFAVKDESLRFNPNEWWLGDGLEFFLTTETGSYDNTGAVKLTNADTLQFFVKPADHGGSLFFAPRTSDEVLAHEDEFVFNIWTVADGYQGEGFIPFTALPGIEAIAGTGTSFAMSVNFGDSDEGNPETDPMAKFMTFSTTRHPTTSNKMIPANMSKFVLEH